jgi:periplasmic protein TonB
MKRFYLLVSLMTLNSFSQVKEKEATIDVDNGNMEKVLVEAVPDWELDDKNKTLFNTHEVDVKPDFPGGMEKFKLYISKKIKIPKEVSANKKKGKVFVQFIIEKDGKLSEIKVLRDFGYGSKEEAERIMKKSPNWLPAEHKGEKVRCRYTIPILIDGTI